MIGKPVKEFLTKQEQAIFDLVKYIGKYKAMVDYRDNTGVTAMMEVGMRIWTGDLDLGVFKDAKSMRNFINIVKNDLMQKLSRLIASDIDVRLENLLNKNVISQNVLEDELNFSLDYFDILRNTDLMIPYKLFAGFGIVKVGWDKYYTAQSWETGIPTVRVVDSRNILLDTNIQQDNFADMEIIAERKTFNTDILAEKLLNDGVISKEKANEIIDMIKDHSEPIDLKYFASDRDNTKYGKTDVIICQYKKPYRLTIRKIKDHVSNDNTIYEALEDDIKALIDQSVYDKITDVDDDEALPEGLEASDPINKRVDSWFEVMFIPSLNLLIYPPYCIGDRCHYVPYAGMKNPNSSYPISEAYEQAQILNIHSVILSILLRGAIKQFKAIPWYNEDGIDDLGTFLTNYENGDAKLKINAEWAADHPGEKPWGWLKAPQSGGDLKILLDTLQGWINQATQSTPTLSGESPGSHASGTLVTQLSQNALDSSKDDYYPYHFSITKICEIVKDLTAEYKNYPHEYDYIGDAKRPAGIVVVNEQGGEIQLLEAAPNCYVRVLQADNNEALKMQEKQEVLNMYQMGLLPIPYTLRRVIDDNAEEVIQMKISENQAFALMTEMQNYPELMQQYQQAVQKLKQQQQQTDDSGKVQPESQNQEANVVQ